MTEIKIPDFEFSGFYYGEILESLLRWKRNNIPELTDENPYDPAIQLLRAFALVGHLNNVLLDACALETFLPTARIRASVLNHLKLIGYNLASYSPSATTLLGDLNQVIASTTLLIPRDSNFKTAETEEIPAIVFENIEDVEVMRSDQLYRCYGLVREENGSGGIVNSINPTYFDGSGDTVTWDSTIIGKIIRLSHASEIGINGDYKVIGLLSSTLIELEGADFQVSVASVVWELRGFTVDYSVEANSAASSVFNPFLKDAISVPVANDIFLISHRDLMWNQIDVDIATPQNMDGVWEYPSGEGWESGEPDSVDNLTTKIRLHLNNFLGTTKNTTGSLIKVTSKKTGAYEYCFTKTFGGENVVETIGKLGQSAISIIAGDYTVGASWFPVPNISDGTSISLPYSLQQDGAIVFTLPYSITESWRKSTLNSIEAKWIRFRMIANAPGAISLESLKINEGTQTLDFAVVQGDTIVQDPLGSGTGLANQIFSLSHINTIDGSIRIWVDNQEWSQVDNFLNSGSVSEHFRFEIDQYGYVTIIFGDSINGAAPPFGTDNIKAEYRIGAENNGNVGSETITQNLAGIAQLTNLRNSKAATGWADKEGGTDESLAKIKISAPQSLRTLNRVVAPKDAEILAIAWSASDGSKPVKRAKAIDEKFGIKTVGLIVVGAYGYAISQDYLDELEEYFNGEEGVLIVNHEIVAINYTPRIIPVSAKVFGGTQSEIVSALEEFLRPDALKENGVDYEWSYGGEVPLSKVYAIIHGIEGVTKVTDLELDGAAVDISLTENELPKAGTLSITIV